MTLHIKIESRSKAHSGCSLFYLFYQMIHRPQLMPHRFGSYSILLYFLKANQSQRLFFLHISVKGVNVCDNKICVGGDIHCLKTFENNPPKKLVNKYINFNGAGSLFGLSYGDSISIKFISS